MSESGPEISSRHADLLREKHTVFVIYGNYRYEPYELLAL